MATFPNNPVSVPVRGSLKLQVRRPVEAVVGPPDTPKKDLGQDYAEKLAVGVPSGFSVDTGSASFIAHQFSEARKRLIDIRNRGCRTCRQQASDGMLAGAEDYLNLTEEQALGTYTVVIVGQLEDGAITVTLGSGSRSVRAAVYAGFLLMSSQDNDAGVATDDEETHLGSSLVQSNLAWLLGV